LEALLALIQDEIFLSSIHDVPHIFRLKDGDLFANIKFLIKKMLFSKGFLEYLLSNNCGNLLKYWVNLLGNCFLSGIITQQDIENIFNIVLCGKFVRHHSYFEKLILELLNNDHQSIYWPLMSAALLSEDQNIMLNAKLLFGSALKSKILSIEHLLAWCSQNPEKAPTILAENIVLIQVEWGNGPLIYKWTELARIIIDKFCYQEETLKALEHNLSDSRNSFGTATSLESYISLFKQLCDHKNMLVANWAQAYVNSFEPTLINWRSKERELDEGILYKSPVISKKRDQEHILEAENQSIDTEKDSPAKKRKLTNQSSAVLITAVRSISSSPLNTKNVPSPIQLCDVESITQIHHLLEKT